MPASTRLLLLVFVVTGAPFFNRNASAQTDSTKCQAWHQKALSGQWFTKREGSEFADTLETEEKLKKVPACGAFFRLQNRCQEAYFTSGGTAARRAELVRTIESVPGCKPIIGFKNVCEVVREAAKSGNLSPRSRSILQECADESIASRTSDLLRPGF